MLEENINCGMSWGVVEYEARKLKQEEFDLNYNKLTFDKGVMLDGVKVKGLTWYKVESDISTDEDLPYLATLEFRVVLLTGINNELTIGEVINLNGVVLKNVEDMYVRYDEEICMAELYVRMDVSDKELFVEYGMIE